MSEEKICNNKGVEVAIADLPRVNGVYHLLSSEEFESLKKHFEGFIAYREENEQLLKSKEKIQELPFSMSTKVWMNKQRTWKIINKDLQQNKPKSALVVGAGCGWLCNLLAKEGIQTIGIDILYYCFDGLETIHYFDSDFTHLLMHPHEISRFRTTFDLIIFENNLAYVKEYPRVLDDAKKLLTAKGKLWLTGLSIRLNKVDKEVDRIVSVVTFFSENYDHNINTYDTKMFLDISDLKQIQRKGFEIKYRKDLRNRIKRIFNFSVVNCDAEYSK